MGESVMRMEGVGEGLQAWGKNGGGEMVEGAHG
jgi:hypothetical protein